MRVEVDAELTAHLGHQPCRQAGNGGCVERCPDVDVHSELGPDLRDQARRQQRVPAEFEEGVICADVIAAEQGREQCGNTDLGRGGGCT